MNFFYIISTVVHLMFYLKWSFNIFTMNKSTFNNSIQYRHNLSMELGLNMIITKKRGNTIYSNFSYKYTINEVSVRHMINCLEFLRCTALGLVHIELTSYVYKLVNLPPWWSFWKYQSKQRIMNQHK